MPLPTTGNAGLDALADAIADRIIARMEAREAPFLEAKEVARRLGRSARSVTQLAAVIPSHRQSGRVMFRWRDVERAIEG